MRIGDKLRSIKTVSDFHTYIKSIDASMVTIETLKYNSLYWIYIGHKDDDIFITVNMDTPTTYITMTERFIDPPNKKYTLDRSVNLIVGNKGRAIFTQAVFDNDS